MSYSISFNNSDDCDSNFSDFHKEADNIRGFDANSSKWKIIKVDSPDDINPGTFAITHTNTSDSLPWRDAKTIVLSIKDFSGENYSKWLTGINQNDRLMIRSVKNPADVGIYIINSAPTIRPSGACTMEIELVVNGVNIYPTINDEYYISHLPTNLAPAVAPAVATTTMMNE
jgi:hypothetical protein